MVVYHGDSDFIKFHKEMTISKKIYFKKNFLSPHPIEKFRGSGIMHSRDGDAWKEVIGTWVIQMANKTIGFWKLIFPS